MITDQSEWKVKASLKPGQKGTLKQYEEFGDKLFCVRYRYKDGFRIKTVEIVIDKTKVTKR